MSILDELFRCPECNGSGKATYIKPSPPRDISPDTGAEPVEDLYVETETVRCRMCNGTGRA